VIVDGTRIIGGKTAYIVTTHTQRPKQLLPNSYTSYYAIEGQSAYVLFSSFTYLYDQICDCPPSEWVKIADCSKNEWKSLDLTMPGDTLPILYGASGETVNAIFQWDYDANGTFNGSQVIPFENSVVNTKIYQTQGIFKYSILEPDSVNFQNGMHALPHQINKTYWLAEGIGIVKFEEKAFNRYVGPISFSRGNRKTLIRYSVK